MIVILEHGVGFGLSGGGKINVDHTNIESIYSEKNTYTIEYKDRGIKISDENGNTNQMNGGSTGIPFVIFCSDGNGYGSYAKVYSLKIYDEEKIVRDYIPVLDQNNKPALYDLVEKKFYYNQCTGEDFIPGPDVNE